MALAHLWLTAVDAADETFEAAEPTELTELTETSALCAPEHERLGGIYDEHAAEIQRFIYSKVHNREDAEDLAALVFYKALRSLDDSRSPESVRGWLYSVARTVVVDHWRARHRLRVSSLDQLCNGGWDTPEVAAAGDAPTVAPERLQDILACLPARYREVLTMRFLANHTISETARLMHITTANAKVLQNRALKRARSLEGCERSQRSTIHR
jgi:RNA polymerase sigma-70 factor (ECF subfamily)